ncbi:MAG: hypothetical protein MJE66_09405 [Proteobacteria bacterium]|nr:hypothetical protein [Pseudomonadota bacterium]
MTRRLLLLTAIFMALSGAAGAAERVSGPYVHDNLGIYLVHGPDRAAGAGVLSLGAALETGQVIVHETGDVNRLEIENVSKTRTVLAQAGDIVKGGKQDRVLSQDLVLAPNSGRVPIDAFCVEQGRWRARGSEPTDSFASSKTHLSSKELKLAARREANQGRVWSEVAQLQDKLQKALGQTVADETSRTSLALSLENEQLTSRVEGYRKALAAIPDVHSDVVGFATAINGRISSAEVYASRALFRQQWPKLLDAAATEAVAERAPNAAPEPSPPADGLSRFLTRAERGKQAAVPSAAPETSDVRETEDALFFESRKEKDDDTWLHRSYLAK